MSGVICLRCKQAPCECIAAVTDRLEAAMDEFAMLPPEARHILEHLSPADMAVALLTAKTEFDTLVVERDHYREELMKAGRLLWALLREAGGQLDVPLRWANSDEPVMLDFEVTGDVVRVTEEEVVPDGER